MCIYICIYIYVYIYTYVDIHICKSWVMQDFYHQPCHEVPSPAGSPEPCARCAASGVSRRRARATGRHRAPTPRSLIPKAPCRVIVDTWALERLPYQHVGVYVYTIELHGAFGNVEAYGISHQHYSEVDLRHMIL